MDERATEVTLILRSWNKQEGLTEHSRVYRSLGELYSACLNVEDPQLIDRIIIRGRGAADVERVLTFVFQSATVQLDD